MSILNCDCPGATSLPTIAYNPCPEGFAKVARIVIQRLDDANNAFVNGTNGIEEANSWSTLPDATNSTKIVITPRLFNVDFAEPTVLEGDENYDGAAVVDGISPQAVTAEMRFVTPAQQSAFEGLMCEQTPLTVIFIDANGKFLARKSGSDHYGIKISEDTLAFIDPYRGGGLQDKFTSKITFSLPQGWKKNTEVVTPEDGFSPLSDIYPS